MIDVDCGRCGHHYQAEPVDGHRLLCGDARDPADVAVLMADVDGCTVAFTSPPYASQRTYDTKSGFEPIPPDGYGDWFEAVQANVRAHLAADGSWFVNIKAHCEDGQRHLYVHDLLLAHVRRWGWRFVDELCWVDAANGMPGFFPNRFKDAWEHVFHFATNHAIKFRPANVSTASDSVPDFSPERWAGLTAEGFVHRENWDRKPGMALPSNVVRIKSGGDGSHSAAFPVALPAWFIRAYSDPGDVVFDPFMGSGSTLIAAQQEGRVAVGCEISPAYCDVVVARWEQYTGRKAVLDGGGG